MGLISWVLGSNRKASPPAPASSTHEDKLGSEFKGSIQDTTPKTNPSSHNNKTITEELGNGDDISDAKVYSGEEPPNLEASSSNKTQVKGFTASTDPVTSSLSSSKVELFGGDDTNFLEEILEDVFASLKVQRPATTAPENNMGTVSLDSTKTRSNDNEEDEESNCTMRLASLLSSGLGAQENFEQSDLPKSTTSGEDDQTHLRSDEDHNEEENQQNEQQDVATEQESLVEELIATNTVLEHLHKPIASTRWADLDEDEDDWTSSPQWTADHSVYREDHPTLENGERGSVGSEAGTSSARSASSEFRHGTGYSGLEISGDIDETSKESGRYIQGSNVETLTPDYSSSESDYSAGYTGPSRSLAFHQYVEFEQAYRHREKRRDTDEAYDIRMQQLWDRYADDIKLLKEPSTIHPGDEDLHDEEMYKVFSDIYPALPSYESYGQMHIFDWKMFVGPDHMGPDSDDEEKFLLQFVQPRLCDAVATALFESDPAALDAWLDPSKKVVEWWHSPHYLHRGVLRTVFRRDGNNVIVGTFTDLGFNVCWSQHIKAVIGDDGKWNETFAFQGGQFQKKPGEKEPGASSRKIRGEIDRDSFEIGEAKYYDEDELWDPVEALWHGRMMAHTLLRNILNNYNQYRGGNTVELFVDGVFTVIEQRGVRRMTRFNAIENDRIEKVVSSPRGFVRMEEGARSSGSSSEVLENDVGF